MKLAEVRIHPYTLPFATPFRTAHGTLHERRGFLVWVRDTDGTWGVGEAAPLDGFAMETPQETARVLEQWSRRLRGATFHFSDPPQEEEPQWAFLDGARHAPAAQHGMELALVDLLARRADRPVAAYLAGRCGDRVPVNATIGAEPPEEAGRRARALVATGFVTIKIKVGTGDLEADVQRVQRVRQVVGPGVRLRADANGAWGEREALYALERLAPLSLEYVEQPVPADELGVMARVARRTPIPIAADEAVQSTDDARRVLDAGAAHVLILKPMALGGPLTVLTVAQLAAAEGLPVVVTTTLDAVVGRLGALHAAVAVDALLPATLPRYACGLATAALLAQDVAADPAPPAAGHMRLPPGPGLGVLPTPPQPG